MLPAEVMQQAQAEFLNWRDSGCSVMEVSHRGLEFEQLAKQAEADLRELLDIPENYKILFRTSNPVETYNFSGVLIEANTDTALDGSTLLGGYKVLGYSTSDPFFKFQYPIAGNINSKVQVDGVEVLEYQSYQEDVQTIPYGHVFTTKQEAILARMNPARAEQIREAYSSRHRMHQPHMDMIAPSSLPKGNASSDQSAEEVVLKEKKKKKY